MEKETSLSRDDLHPQPADGNAGKEQREKGRHQRTWQEKFFPALLFFLLATGTK